MTICKGFNNGIRCKKYAHYNYEGETIRSHCKKHKLENMVNVVNKRCISENCTIMPVFNYKGCKTALYCSGHKLENMVDVNNRTCMRKDCNIRPCFNYEGEKTALYCFGHKLENMVNVTKKKCMRKGCSTRPSFNYEGCKTALYCFGHKLKNMVNVKSKTCISENCTTIPVFNYKGEKTGLYCSDHKLENMVDVVTKKCESENCKSYIAQRYSRTHCLQCFIYNNPGHIQSRNYKSKENEVFLKLFELNPELKNISIRDKIISGGCSKRRPDLLIKLKTYWICVENDENCHRGYDNDCDNLRTIQLYDDMLQIPMVIIRFNCDKYDDQPSLFCLKDGKVAIKNKKIFHERINFLNETIKKHLNYNNGDPITSEYLFYNTTI
jgi:hypothetical protein